MKQSAKECTFLWLMIEKSKKDKNTQLTDTKLRDEMQNMKSALSRKKQKKEIGVCIAQLCIANRDVSNQSRDRIAKKWERVNKCAILLQWPQKGQWLHLRKRETNHSWKSAQHVTKCIWTHTHGCKVVKMKKTTMADHHPWRMMPTSSEMRSEKNFVHTVKLINQKNWNDRTNKQIRHCWHRNFGEIEWHACNPKWWQHGGKKCAKKGKKHTIHEGEANLDKMCDHHERNCAGPATCHKKSRAKCEQPTHRKVKMIRCSRMPQVGGMHWKKWIFQKSFSAQIFSGKLFSSLARSIWPLEPFFNSQHSWSHELLNVQFFWFFAPLRNASKSAWEIHTKTCTTACTNKH